MLMILAHVLGSVWVVEQPSSSVLADHIRFQWMLRALERFEIKASWLQVVFSSKLYRNLTRAWFWAPMSKLRIHYQSLSFLFLVFGIYSCGGGVRDFLVSSKPPMDFSTACCCVESAQLKPCSLHQLRHSPSPSGWGTLATTCRNVLFFGVTRL